ncbi:MAG: substrate binding domain-containing protein [Cyanobacteria bacterium]|nr:substrate binding domain-containing protein [Cyanobacteriota bacterium]
MDTDHLEIFVDCMRRRRFAAVARERGVDPATISRTIALLEEQLQLRLFHRSTRRIEPTDAGQVYFERVEPIVEELQRARLQASDVSSSPQGLLRISSPVSFAQHNIIPSLHLFSKQYPDLRYELLLTETHLDLLTEHIDVAIRIGTLSDSSLIAHKLAPLQGHIAASPEYLQMHGKPKTPIELAKHPALLLDLAGFNRNRWQMTNPRGRKVEVKMNEFLRTSNALALKQCALNHMGIILLPRWLIGRELKNGQLIDLFPGYTVSASAEGAAAWALQLSREYTPQKTKLFIDFLKQLFRDGPPWENIQYSDIPAI